MIAGDSPVLVHNNDGDDECLVTVYHYTDKKGYNSIMSGDDASFKVSDKAKNGEGIYFTPLSPEDVAKKGPSGFKSSGLHVTSRNMPSPSKCRRPR